MTPTWLMRVLEQVSAEGHELNTPAGRAAVAEAIAEALPARTIALAIAESTNVVLNQRGLLDGDLSREVGNNDGQRVLFALSGGS